MSEAEFGRLMDAVNAAVAPIPHEDFVAGFSAIAHPMQPANDNGLVWPLLPFPEGWCATC